MAAYGVRSSTVKRTPVDDRRPSPPVRGVQLPAWHHDSAHSRLRMEQTTPLATERSSAAEWADERLAAEAHAVAPAALLVDLARRSRRSGGCAWLRWARDPWPGCGFRLVADGWVEPPRTFRRRAADKGNG
jgi:hypothetical protein